MRAATCSDGSWERIALTQEQVDANPRLSGLVITKKDNRYKPHREYQAVECEAVGQVVLMQMVRERLDALLPEPIADVLVREQTERDARSPQPRLGAIRDQPSCCSATPASPTFRHQSSAAADLVNARLDEAQGRLTDQIRRASRCRD